MNVLIVYAHPSQKSFTYQVLEALIEGLQASNRQIEISDLYRMNFQTDMTEKEYEREGFAHTKLPVPEDVAAEQQKIERADCIIFLYPVWWSDCPAKLKGWFDRVYSVGYAYGYDEQGQKVRKMKKIKYGFVICTAGHPAGFLEATGIAESMRNVMINDRLGVRFEHKTMIILSGTLDIENVRECYLAEIRRLGGQIESYF